MIYCISMARDTLTFLPPRTRAELRELGDELGIKDTRVLVRKAVEDKLLDVRRGSFFGITDKVRKGLLRRGIKPSVLLKSFRT